MECHAMEYELLHGIFKFNEKPCLLNMKPYNFKKKKR